MLAAIVPATDRPATLSRCLDAIKAATDGPDELIVVERSSGAGSAAARNEGVRRATGDLLVFVDADVAVHRDVFSRIRAAFLADPELTAIFGSYDDSPPAAGLVSVFRNLLHHDVHQTSAGLATTFWTGLGAIRRDAFVASGGFDPTRLWIADIELGMRLAATGARIRLDPGLLGKHLKVWGLWDMVRTDFSRRGVPWVELLLRYRSLPSALNLGWRHRLSAAVSAAILVGVLGRRPGLAAVGTVLLVALNRSFYALLLRRLGLAGAAGGIALHALHHLTGLAAVPAGVLVIAAKSTARSTS